MNEQLILNILNQIETQAIWLIVKAMLVIIVVLILQGFAQRVAAYIQFRFSKKLGTGIRVRVQGIEGKIEDYNLRWIIIKTDSGMEMLPIKGWQGEKWTLLDSK
jgi:hypothetical protein